MQLALPCLLFAPAATKLILKGGTNAEMAPPIDYMTDVSDDDDDDDDLDKWATDMSIFYYFAEKWDQTSANICVDGCRYQSICWSHPFYDCETG